MSDTDRPIEQQLAADLRAFADWIETRPAIAEEMRYSFRNLYAFPSKGRWSAVLREAGTFTKDSDANFLLANVTQGEHIGIRIAVEKEETCERIQVGEREVEREVYPADVTPAVVKEMEPVYEWRCPPSWIAEETAVAS